MISYITIHNAALVTQHNKSEKVSVMKKEARCCEVTMLTKLKVRSSYKAQLCGEWAVMEVDRQWSLIVSAFHQLMITHQNVMQSSFPVKYSRIGGKFCSLPTVKASPITRNTLHSRENPQEATLENSPPITRIALNEETLVNDDERSNFSQEERGQTLSWANCIQ